jgi:hypothetical protein
LVDSHLFSYIVGHVSRSWYSPIQLTLHLTGEDSDLPAFVQDIGVDIDSGSFIGANNVLPFKSGKGAELLYVEDSSANSETSVQESKKSAPSTVPMPKVSSTEKALIAVDYQEAPQHPMSHKGRFSFASMKAKRGGKTALDPGVAQEL